MGVSSCVERSQIVEKLLCHGGSNQHHTRWLLSLEAPKACEREEDGRYFEARKNHRLLEPCLNLLLELTYCFTRTGTIILGTDFRSSLLEKGFSVLVRLKEQTMNIQE
jgi:hypothetical protein